MEKYNAVENPNLTIVKENTSSLINTGFGQSNMITIIAHDKQVYFYINKHIVTQLQDTVNSDGEFNSGTFGLVADDHDTQLTEIAFSNVQIWALN